MLNIHPVARGIGLSGGAFGSPGSMFGLRVAYIGSQASHLLEVEAAGDLVFSHGVLSSEAADTTVSGDGTIAVSGLTIGEVVDLINESDNWLASPADLPRSFSADNTLATRAAAAVGDAGTLIAVDPAELDALQTSKVSLSKGLGLESANDLENSDMLALDRLTFPGGRFRNYRKQLIDYFRSRVTGVDYAAANSVYKIVRERWDGSAWVEESVWHTPGASGGVKASGTIVFADNPVADTDTITLNGVEHQFTTAASSGTGIEVKGSLPLTLDEVISVLNASVNASISVATYTEDGTDTLTITYDVPGTVGNAYTLAASSDTPSAANLENGAEGSVIEWPDNGARRPLVIGNRGERIYLVFETTESALPESADLTLSGYVEYHEGGRA